MTQTSRDISICFDLDGTFIDTAPDLIRVLNLVIAEDGVPETDFLSARNQVGFGAKHLIRMAYSRANRDITDDRLEALWHLFLQMYEDNICELSRPFPGVEDTLHTLKQSGYKLSVCTNKPGYLARPLVKALNLTHYFDRVVGSGDGVRAKPSPDLIFAAAGHRQHTKIVMIGDSLPDVSAARHANCPVILMSYGYADTPYARLRPDLVLRRFRDLPNAIKQLTS